MSISSERYFLGGLINEIDKDINPDKLDNVVSKDETDYKTSQEQNFSSNNSVFSNAFPATYFSPSLKTSSFLNQKNQINTGQNFVQKIILFLFLIIKINKSLMHQMNLLTLLSMNF